MEQLIKRMISKLFPELTAGYHLPIFGEVVGVREFPQEGDLCEEFRPRYAVDVQVLTENGDPDTTKPVLRDVMLSVPMVGQERGQFAFPDDGVWVELAFAYGSPNRPFIRSVLTNRMTLPPVERGEQRWQHNPASFQRVDKDGSWQRKTDLAIEDESLERFITALDNLEQYHQSLKETATNDTEIIGAIKKVQAYGAMVLESGGSFDIASLGHLRLTTKANALIRVIGDIDAKTNGKQHFEAPKSWVGSSSENALRLMSELAQLVIDMANILATHTHPDAGVINQGGQISSVGSATSAVKTRIDTIAE
ncbi:hypothetical protein [Methylophaga sp.]|uniref:hypothetical protein n=1 Tax=Methylophaga sp. TaxID=2024840 RepID=UPI0025EA4EDA|nr:hypothetical protein [Methylophaga sp.]